jgi:hypothetical protein
MQLHKLFARFGWAVEEPEPGILRARFSAESEEEFDLYALADARWLRLAVTPLIARVPEEERPGLAVALLEANGGLAGVRFALDDEGDVALHGDLPVANLTYAQFATLLETLVEVANEVATHRGRWP